MKSYTCDYIVKEAASKRDSLSHFDLYVKAAIDREAGAAVDAYLPEYIDNLRYSDADLDKETNWAAKYPTRAKLYNAGKAMMPLGVGTSLLGLMATPVVDAINPKYVPAALGVGLGGVGSTLLGGILSENARPPEITKLKAKLNAAADRKAYEIKQKLMSSDKFKRDFLFDTAFGNLDESTYDYDTVMLDLLAKHKVPKKVDLGVEIPRY
jgi:hypothetical protein